MNIFCPRCGGYTPPRVSYCRVCGGKVQALREKMGDVLAAPAKVAAGALPRAVPAAGPPPARAAAASAPPARPAPAPAAAQAMGGLAELDLGGGDLNASGPLGSLSGLGGG